MLRGLHQLARSAGAMRRLRLTRLWWYARHGAHHDWRKALSASRWECARAEAGGPRILMATSVGLHFGATHLDSLLAVALTLRGAQVESLLCDALLPACMAADLSWEDDLAGFARHGMHKGICRQCYGPARDTIAALGLPIFAYSEFITDADRQAIAERARTIAADDIPAAAVNGIPVGEHATAGCLRFFGRGTLKTAPHWDSVLRAYFEAALLAEAAFREMLRRRNYDVIVAHHGIYVPQGLLIAVARQMGVRIVTWNVAYRRKCFVFSHDDSYHHTMISEPVEAWDTVTLNADEEEAIADYLASRAEGARDWISFQRASTTGDSALAREFGLDGRPRIGLLTNVYWDAQLHFPGNIFPSMREWLIETVRYFETRPDLQLIIRVHPAEVSGAIPSREPVVEILADAFGTLPENIVVVPPDHPANTYGLMRDCNAVVIFGTKTGIELTAVGKPVIVAGEAWIKNKGITMDPRSRDEYLSILGRLPLKESDAHVDRKRALKYAYHYFFRRMIPVDCVEQSEGFPPFRIGDVALSRLEAGADQGLDVICNGIMTGAPFVCDSGRPRRPGDFR